MHNKNQKASRRFDWYMTAARVIWGMMILYEAMDEKLDNAIQEEGGTHR
ncbi:MAG: hypothetical protein ABI413_02240 [Ktedonobacteraceae bacterium]